MSTERYRLTLTAEELALTRDALDLYSRLQMGQAWIIAQYVDRADMSADGRRRLEAALLPVQSLITGEPRPGVSRYPTGRARDRGQRAGSLYEHARYALCPDPMVRPLAYAPWRVRRDRELERELLRHRPHRDPGELDVHGPQEHIDAARGVPAGAPPSSLPGPCRLCGARGEHWAGCPLGGPP